MGLYIRRVYPAEIIQTMQINSSILVTLVIACFLGVKAIPLTPIEQQIVRIPPGWPYPFNFCGTMGTTCKNTTDCCESYGCDYTGGYDDSTIRCCGQIGASGCAIISGSIYGKGCCPQHYCDYTDSTQTKTQCYYLFTK